VIAETSSELAVREVKRSSRADPTDLRLSASVLLGSLIAAGAGARLHPEWIEVSASAVFAAIVLFLACLARYNAAAQAAE
jgi:hypothetical protein